jgi:hypothetical protein
MPLRNWNRAAGTSRLVRAGALGNADSLLRSYAGAEIAATSFLSLRLSGGLNIEIVFRLL